MSKQWFHSWFNSPYYHVLYNRRDTTEAQTFINHLNARLQLPPGARILDVGCGRGRHACYLHKEGYEVTGIDLSVTNIEHALQYQTAGLQFFAHDMRSLYYQHYFNAAVNLFTSFGYFSTFEQHIQVLQHICNALLPGGLLVLDYLNSELVCHKLVVNETKVIDGITFLISKRIADNRVFKNIHITDGSHTEEHEEQVALFRLNDFKNLFEKSGFSILNIFGNYTLQQFDAETSDRLIFICKKK